MNQRELFKANEAKKNSTPLRFTLKNQALEDLLKALRNLGCTYFVIDEGGAEFKHGDVFANVKVKANKLNRRPLNYKMGELSNYLRPFIKDLKAGDAVVVPGGDYGAVVLQSSLTSLCNRTFGKGKCMTRTNTEENTIEVLRVY